MHLVKVNHHTILNLEQMFAADHCSDGVCLYCQDWGCVFKKVTGDEAHHLWVYLERHAQSL